MRPMARFAVVCAALGPIASAPSDTQQFDAKGRLLFPADYREWIYLSTGFDMSYVDAPTGMHMFDNVFVNPAAYRVFRETGHWPDKTIFLIEARGAKSKGSINKSGSYQGDIMAFEVHVRDSARFKGNWAFFRFAKAEGSATEVPHDAACYACHEAHAAVDTTFVQFYPTLFEIAKQNGTLSANYLKDEPQ
jgi:Cytochrome P460